jgi:Tol biopolymer transport system component
MASVFKAFQPSLERYVAVKVLPPYYMHEPDFAQRFVREARAVARLEHPHILPLYDFGQEGDYTYIVMKYVPAGTLKDLVAAGPMDTERAAEIVEHLAQALDYAHDQGIIHRDVKPSNVLMDRGTWALLMDFGLAKMVEGSVQLTASGVGVGTPAYMAPEQGQGLTVDRRADVYSLGVVLYEMLTGRVPFDAETPMAVVIKHITEPLPMPRAVNPAIPEHVELAILKALAKAPQDRYQTCGEMAASLRGAPERQTTAFTDAFSFDEAAPFAVEPLEPLPQEPVVTEPTAPQPAQGAAMETDIQAPLPAPEPEAALPPRKAAQTSETAERVPEAAVPAPAPETKVVPGKRKMPWWVFVAAAVVVIAVVGAILVATGVFEAEEEMVPTAAAALPAQPAATATPAYVDSGLSAEDGARWVEPCAWQGQGGGICIYAGPEIEARILADDDLQGLEFGLAVWSPDGRQIAFGARPLGTEEPSAIYVVNADGSDLRQLPQQGNDFDPDWHPEGEWLLFHSDCRVMSMTLDGREPHVLWEEGERCAFFPQWSPDGEHIAFSVLPGGEPVVPLTREVWMMALGDGQQTILAEVRQEAPDFDNRLAFSPDGEQIAFVDDGPRILLVPIDGSAEPVPLSDFPHGWHASHYPRWSGEMPEIVNEELFAEGRPSASGPPEEPVHVAPCDWEGSGDGLCIYSLVEEKAPARILEDDGFQHIGRASWRPDGRQLVLSGVHPDAGADVEGALYIVNADGTNLTQITSADNSILPSWSPDGEWIVFHRNCDLARIHPDGSEMDVVWRAEGRCVVDPHWAPDSERIVFSVSSNAEWTFPMSRDIYVIRRDGSGFTQVATTAHGDEAHLWADTAFSPDGAQVAYFDGENRAHLVRIENPDEVVPVRDFPYMWMSSHYPQWGE